MTGAQGWRDIESAGRRGAEALAVLRVAADRARARNAELARTVTRVADSTPPGPADC